MQSLQGVSKQHMNIPRILVPRWTGLVCVCLLLLAGCGNGPPPKMYLLEPFTDVDGVLDASSPQKSLGSLGISTVVLPGYANDVEIATLEADGTVLQEDRHRWAEEPSDAMTRVLAERLRKRALATVLIEPWPRDYDPRARVEVVFDRLLREPLGGVDMAGNIYLLSGDGRRLLKSLAFEFVRFGRDTDRRVFFVAVADGIDDIATMAVQAMLELDIKS